ncbi:DUF1552 domain-containing protein [Chryseolinea sp. T2]|uniref:DUF1552 domain-containing protein n=1 Tax=Chryseolinea sp. T2 TaxID=3129255 RepID=UPI0030788D1B
MSKKWHISRRRMLKGMGACIALPFLEAMAIPGQGSTGKAPVRTAFLFMPNGVHPDRWTPATTGNTFELTPQLLPLQKFQKDIVVLGELMNKNSLFKGADGHYAKSASLLTCMPIKQTIGDNISSGGVSIDQVIAGDVGKDTLFPSLEYGLDRITTGVDINVGFTRLYGSSISWKSPNQPLSKEIDPRLAFDRLFRPYVPGVKIKADPYKQSILDLVLDDANELKRHLGRADQDKVSEYLESIYSVEKRISNDANRAKFAKNISPDITRELVRLNKSIDEYKEVYAGVNVTEKTRLMLDIMALAFWSDASRVSTFMFGNSVSDRNFSFLDGVKGNHHSISHHMDKPEALEEYTRITSWHISQYAYFLDKLQNIREGDKTLLENSMVVFTSDLRDGNRHSPRNLPVVLAGQGGGRIRTGQNLIFEKETPLANLYLTMLHTLNIQHDRFGDSTGTLKELV